jgi:hypothetical protein
MSCRDCGLLNSSSAWTSGMMTPCLEAQQACWKRYTCLPSLSCLPCSLASYCLPCLPCYYSPLPYPLPYLPTLSPWSPLGRPPSNECYTHQNTNTHTQGTKLAWRVGSLEGKSELPSFDVLVPLNSLATFQDTLEM